MPWNPLSYPMVKTASLYNNFCKTGNYVIYDVIIWVQDGNCKKMARENFSIGALYIITRNQDNPIKTVGWDSFFEPQIKFLGVTQPPGVAQPLYSRGHYYTQTYNIYPSLIEIGSKTAEKKSAQTNRQTDKPTDTTKIMVTWPWTKNDAWKYVSDVLD